LYGKFDKNPLFAAAVHGLEYVLINEGAGYFASLIVAMIEDGGGPTQVTGVTGPRCRKFPWKVFLSMGCCP
jgi:hypothetical protein